MYKSKSSYNNRRNAMSNYNYTTSGQHNWRETEAAKAASQAIEKTIQGMEDRIGVKFPRGSTPSESREIMYEWVAVLVRRRNKT